MNSVITIDATELTVAAPRVTDLHLRLVDSAARLTALDLAVEMPPGVRGRVAGFVDSARSDLLGAARSIDGMGADIARRAGLAELADKLGALSRLAGPVTVQLKAMARYSRDAATQAALRGNLSGARANRAFELRFDRLARRLGLAGKLAGLVPGAVADIRNPYTSGQRKAGQVAASAAESAALSTATKLAVGALGDGMAATALGGPVGLGIAVAWTAADYKFHLDEHIADGATWLVDKAGDGIGKVGEGVGKGASAAGHAIGKVTPWDGVAPW
jgi:hypothetical protein